MRRAARRIPSDQHEVRGPVGGLVPCRGEEVEHLGLGQPDDPAPRRRKPAPLGAVLSVAVLLVGREP
ncbi:hypothetical protein [Streptomyces xantholiticus]|uniref:hypothetical protein n=1 Tax=Streptomyces xantholiticus TaxID=68285 RepID=UPI0016768824|nr:hypothetical protein [Streptomyces xantholiticus]GGW22411.1 hypothetical protein GCM10010381_00110 [Streptomyces xantholiticus]